MKILFAGRFDPGYNRTKIIIDGLKAFPDVRVSFYCYPSKRRADIYRLYKECKQADVIFLPSFTHLDVPLIKAISNKPIIFDPLISRYLTKVFDYRKVSRYSPRALKNFLKDKISMELADIVICDTYAHKRYFKSKIGISDEKLKVIPVGVNTEEFKPAISQTISTKFTVGFYGSFIPLQGTRVIVETAKLLETDTGIHFKLIGEGFEYRQVKKMALETYGLTNVSFLGWVPYADLCKEINSFDIALGIFGETLKADLVIPNKIFHYAALKKAIISKDSPAMREVFKDQYDILLTTNRPEEIAAKIISLRDNPELRMKMAVNAFGKIAKDYSHLEIARKVVYIAEELLTSTSKY